MSTDQLIVFRCPVHKSIQSCKIELPLRSFDCVPFSTDSVRQRPRLSNVARIIYLFSGVTCPKSALMIAAFEAWFRVLESAQVPKYSLLSFLKIASMPPSEPRSSRGLGVLRPSSSLSQSMLKISWRSPRFDRTLSTLGAARDRTIRERRKVEISEPRMMSNSDI
jgi:hypothetical protein